MKENMLLFEYAALLRKNYYPYSPEIVEFLKRNDIIDPILSVAGEPFWEESAIKNPDLFNRIKVINAIHLMSLAMKGGQKQHANLAIHV